MNRPIFTTAQRRQTANKQPDAAGYRPYLELDCRLCRQFASDSERTAAPLIVADVGAAHGFDPRWALFAPNLRQIGFEPEPAECRRLQEGIAAGGRTDREAVLPVALAAQAGTRTLYVTRDPDASSLYRPNMAFFARMPDPSGVEVTGEVAVETTTLDSMELPFGDSIDVLKLDVQGAELDVLRGAEQRIEGQLLAVVAEASFVELYEGQGMFADIDLYLRARGFELFDICYRRWSRKRLGPAYDGLRVGQMTYGDVLYLKDPLAGGMQLTPDRLVKLTALAEFFSLPDYALELIELGVAQGLHGTAEAEAMAGLVEANRIVAYHDRNRLPR